jgi:hypothetical protein
MAGIQTGVLVFAIHVKTGISKMKDTYFVCMGTEHLRHQLNHLFDNISDGDIKGFIFQHITVDLFDWFFIGTYRHARLEAFVI